ncbi:MAG: GntR family transcriptional regulator [Candidatus Fermentibacteraceae bacterium]
MFRVDPDSPVPVYEQLKRQIRLGIVSGAYPPDHRMASIRELATELTVNPNTIAKVYGQLETEGFLVSRAGSGFYVRAGQERVLETRHELLAELAAEFVARSVELGLTPNEIQAALIEELGRRPALDTDK